MIARNVKKTTRLLLIILRNPKNIRLKLAKVIADIVIEKLITFTLINLKKGYKNQHIC